MNNYQLPSISIYLFVPYRYSLGNVLLFSLSLFFFIFLTKYHLVFVSSTNILLVGKMAGNNVSYSQLLLFILLWSLF